jgi:hypothetical protein
MFRLNEYIKVKLTKLTQYALYSRADLAFRTKWIYVSIKDLKTENVNLAICRLGQKNRYLAHLLDKKTRFHRLVSVTSAFE